jgi:uncharacterized repeat protein (TIGR01451 family)
LPGTYTITPSAATGGTFNPENYSITYSNGVLTVSQAADVIVLISGPPTAILGSNIVYSVVATNAGPSASSNLVVSVSLPTNMVFVSASDGGNYSNSIVTWPLITSLSAGDKTNYTFTVKSLITGLFTNIASALAVTYDPNPTNNTGVSSASQAQIQVNPVQSTGRFDWIAGTPVFNPQTGLYEERVLVTNNTGTNASALRIFVTGLRSGVYLLNAYGTNSGQPYALYNYPFPNGSSQSFLLEFVSVDRHTFTNGIRVEITANVVLTPATGSTLALYRIFQETYSGVDPHQVIEFLSTSGRSYMILYGDTPLTVTNVAIPTIKATANKVQWIDDGPPKTASNPAESESRFYKVILLP